MYENIDFRRTPIHVGYIAIHCIVLFDLEHEKTLRNLLCTITRGAVRPPLKHTIRRTEKDSNSPVL